MDTEAKQVTEQEYKKWEAWADVLRFGSIAALFPTIFFLDAMEKAQAKQAVWWLVIPIFIVGTIGFVVGNVANKKTVAYLRQRHEAMKARHDKMLGGL